MIESHHDAPNNASSEPEQLLKVTLPPMRCLSQLPPETFELIIATDPESLAEAGKLWPVTDYVAEHFARTFPVLREADSERGMNVLELGAGTGALGIAIERYLSASGYSKESSRVMCTDLEPVVPLMRKNVGLNKSRALVEALPWGCSAGMDKILSKLPSNAPSSPSFNAVLVCECLYWGGWSLVAEDTRPLLRRTLDQTAPNGSEANLFIGFTVRDFGREIGFMRSLLGEFEGHRGYEIESWLDPKTGVVKRVGDEEEQIEFLQSKVEGDVIVLCLMTKK